MFTRKNPVVEMPADGPVTVSGGALAYGGFWARFAALIIDNAILTIVAMVLIVVASLVDESLAAVASLAYFVAALVYWPLMESSSLQATLGKQLLGLQVTDGAGERLSFVRALLRNIAKIISALPLYIGFLLAAFTSRKQALHDIITNCVVVRTGPSHFLKAAGATAAALIITFAGGYYYVSSIYNAEMEKAEQAMKAQQAKPAAKQAPKPLVEQVRAPGQAAPASKPAPAPAVAQSQSVPVKPAAAPPTPEPAAKPAATAQVKEPTPPVKVAAAPVSASTPAKPATGEKKPAPAKPAVAEMKPAPAKLATAELKPMPTKPAAAAAAVKAKPAPRPEPVVTAAAPAEDALKAPRQAPAPRPAPAMEETRVPAAAAGPTPVYNDVMTAVMYRDPSAVAQLLDLGWWPDRPDSNGVTPLMAAAMNGDAAITELLLRRGADPLRRGPGGSTLDYAGRGGNAQVLELLRKAGAR